MMKRLFAVLAAAALVLTAAGCSAGGNDLPPQNADSAVTFTDALGREVTVNKPEKAAALLGSFAEVWTLAGGQLAAAPDDAWNDMELSLSEDVLDLGKINELSLETLLSADPDFIIASSQVRIDLEWLDTIESTDIPIAYFDVSDFDDYLAMLKICTDITGRTDLYQKNGLDVKNTVDGVIEKSKQRVAEKGAPEVLSLRASASYVRAKSSRGNVLGKMLDTLGCVNIADGNDAFLEKISIEHIIERDPDFIFVVQTGDDKNGAQETLDAFIADYPAWSGLTAVKEGRVYFMDKRLYNLKPNARWGEAYEKLEEILDTDY
ncbi:MAG: ABC transporter substrate-binding protein [Oscillospiraceae bacterium]|nr:ABC transporter substrate-binding protein [Oscillospiraceae bacterium]